ncbi:MAG: molybdopterin-synthase adenylyltransferase MoeB [Candidatus Sumerlaeaceae bacterium]|nr:molybdopterin-synthase adenylyltransferase MoeB [Candidatus Sumerlaeaceae bacterium]
MTLSEEQRQRYLRHILLPEIGTEGQETLLAAKVLIVGAGGLGSPAALYLAAAGVGTLGIVDADVVDASNLQRQVLHSTAEVGRLKVDSARRRLKALNPDIEIITHPVRLTSANALEIIRLYDVVVDGCDNFPTRYLTNDACVFLRKPNVYGALYRFEGQASVFHTAAGGPCYRCLFPEPPPPGAVPSCAEAGVLGVLPGIIGTIQATETIKLLLGIGRSLMGRLLIYDALQMEFRSITLKRDPRCPVCGDSPTIHELIDYENFCRRSDSVTYEEITVDELYQKLSQGEGEFVLIDCRNHDEHAQARISGARLIPLPELAKRIGELDDCRNKTVIVHCARGGRSARACELLTQAGFEKTVNVRGGIVEWIEKGYPVERNC